MAWEEWIQDVGKDVIGKWSEREYTQDYNLQAMRLQALGEMGLYTEGQAGTGVIQRANAGGIAPGLLIMGGVLIVGLLIMRGR